MENKETSPSLKAGDEMMLLDAGTNEPTIYNCDMGVVIKCKGDIVYWKSQLGGEYMSPKERVIPRIKKATPKTSPSLPEVTAEKILDKHLFNKFDEVDRKTFLAAMEEYANLKSINNGK